MTACLPLMLLAAQPGDAGTAVNADEQTATAEIAANSISDRHTALPPETGGADSGPLTVFFAFDEAALTPPARRALDDLAPRLRAHLAEGGGVVIAGHADATGDAVYNLDLSARRARAVAGFLHDAWAIPPARLTLRAWGESDLRRPDAPAHAENRRVEIRLLEPRLARSRGVTLRLDGSHPDLHIGRRHLDIDDFGGAFSPLPFPDSQAGRIITMHAPGM